MADYDGRRQLPIMVRPGRKSQKPFWPFMEMWGLYRKPIAPDGNCLFRSLSDQIYDTPDRHDEIRQKIIDYLRGNREKFEPFVPSNTEQELVRSQPKTRSSRSRKVNVDEDSYEIYLQNMAKPKTWGGEIEIRAFCEAYDRDVLIHRPTDAGQPFDQMVNNKHASGQPRQFVHVSFGGEENHPHYESVRRVERADNNSPQSPNPTSTTSSLSDPADRTISLSEYSAEPLSQLQQARPSLSAEELHEFLEKSRNQLDATFAQIINTDRERSSSVSSASRRSSSSKRSREDDEESDRVAKRQVRRISLRNRTRAFVSYTTPASSLRGTEISFNIRIDTPPSTPTKAEASQGSGAVEEKKEPEAERHMEDKEGKKGKEDKEKGRAKEAEEGEEGGAEHGRGRTKSRGKTA